MITSHRISRAAARSSLCALGVLLFVCSAQASTKKAGSASSVSAYELKKLDGSRLVDQADTRFEQYQLQDKSGYPKVTGAIVRRLYIAPGTTPLEAFLNYREQLAKDGFVDIYVNDSATYSFPRTFCNQPVRICGSYEGGSDVFHLVNMQNQRYLSARKQSSEGDLHVAVIVGELKRDLNLKFSNGKSEKAGAGTVLVGIDFVQPKALEKKMVPESAAMIERELSSKGKVDLYGIFFDFNKADLKPESAPTIEEVAKVLKANPALKLSVAGHTDNVGDKAYNVKLSGLRAQAVMNELVKKHGVQAARLKSAGLGDSKPVASNDTEEGRAKNRRVELVKL